MPPPMALGRIFVAREFCLAQPIGGLLIMTYFDNAIDAIA